MKKIINGKQIDVNEEGFLEDFSEWTKEIGQHIAKEENIDMSDKHWNVIDYLQEQERNEISLSIRRIGKSGVVSIKELYSLFPNGPLKTSCKIAGIPKPVSCI